MITVPNSQIQTVNSTSYIDMLGVLAGLERFPGETSQEFAERIQLAVAADRSASYVGLMNSLAIELGLYMKPVASVSSDLGFDLAVDFGSLTISNEQESRTVNLLSLTSDDFWQWKSISEVVAEFAGLSTITVKMAGADGPAIGLVQQSNRMLVTGESLIGSTVERLAHGKIVPGSERFDQDVPSYTIGADGQTLHFSSPCPAGAAITYRYRRCPYSLISSPVSVLSLTDPRVGAWAVGSNGKVIYQVREYVQEILRRDGSYWGR